MKISAILMASGASNRMGTNKLHLQYEGKSFIQRLFDLTEEMLFYETILVVSPQNQIGLTIPKNIKVVVNHSAEQGQNYSVRLGTEAASGDGYLYLPVDQPLLKAELLAELLPYYDSEHIVFPTHKDGQPSSPVFFGKQFRSELLSVSGKGGGRSVRNAHPEAWCAVTVSSPKLLTDVDTPEVYQSLLMYEKLKNS